jgi:hypothetical protein
MYASGKTMKETEKAIGNMLNAIQQGIYGESTKQRLDDLEEQKRDIEVKILREQINHNRMSRGQIVHWLEHFRKLDLDEYEHRESLVRVFVNATYVYDDHIVLVLNYMGDAQTIISLADVDGAGIRHGYASRLHAKRAQDGVSRSPNIHKQFSH